MIVYPTEEIRAQLQLVQDAYDGGGGFANGGHLFKYPREQDFTTRQSMAYYINYLKPIVDSKVQPVFTIEPQREFNDATGLVDAFLLDADNNSTSLSDLVKSATLQTVLKGNGFLIVDNFKLENIPQSLADTIEQRKYPFVYEKQCEDIYKYELDDFGKLLNISFFYGMYTPENSSDEVYLYKRFTKTEIEHFYVEQKLTQKVTTERMTTVHKSNHTLGIVPVAYYNRDIVPLPPTYYSLATLARSIYNSSSEIQDLQRAQSFNILLIPSTTPGQDAQDNLVLSAHNALFFDSDAKNKPEYISPDSAIQTVNQAILDKQLSTMLNQADVLGTSVETTSTGSGIAEAYKFFAKKQALLESSVIASNLDKQVLNLFSLFTGSDYKYEVEYNKSFAPTFAENKQQIESLEAVGNMNISPTVTAMVNATIVEIVSETMEWKPEELDTALGSITEKQEVENGVE